MSVVMWRFVRSVIVFILLLIFGNGRHDKFVQRVIRQCKKRYRWTQVDGITEELDEVVELPEDSLGDTHFVGFNKDGQLASFRVTREDNTQEHACVSLEFPGMGRFTFTDSRPPTFGTGKLQLQMLEPMRRWRITFHGSMECHLGTGVTERLHVSVSLYWKGLADPFDHFTSLSRWQLAKNLSDHFWDRVSWKDVLDREFIWYEQWGEMWGRVEIEGHASQYIRLKGFRSRQIGYRLETASISHHVIQDGGRYYITNGCTYNKPGVVTESFGYLTVPAGERWATTQSDLRLQECNSNLSSVRIRYPFHISGYENLLLIDKEIERGTPLDMRTGPTATCISFSTYTINGKRAQGVQCHNRLSLDKHSKKEDVGPIQNSIHKGNPDQITLNFYHDHCKNPSVVGGKCASLSLLTSREYLVPRGFCVTTLALNIQLGTSADLLTAKERIADKTKNKATMDWKDACDKAVQQWTKTQMCHYVASAIEQELTRTFGQDYDVISFAVRSSSVSEDGTEASYAGQMETFLGVKGLDDVLLAVRKCWASSFSFQSVEYRRQNGQPATEPMAVVIQEMVDADVAGVLFTNDPVTGNSSDMVVNAAPGLGEKVVAGKINPDTAKVSRNKGPDKLQVVMKTLGVGLEKLESEREDNELCIQDTQLLDLCRLGLQIEESFGSPQDIEWALRQGRIYILQTRPITSLVQETDEELLQEFDTPMAMDDECVTRFNVGEAMPGPLTTLSREQIERCTIIAIRGSFCEYSGYKSSCYIPKWEMFFTNKAFINMTNMALLSEALLQDKESIDISVSGRVLDEVTRDMIDMYKGRQLSFLSRLRNFIVANFIHMPNQLRWFETWMKELDTFTVGSDATSVEDLYKSLDGRLDITFRMSLAYAYKALQSLVPYSVLFKLLRGKNQTVSQANNEDIAVLLAKCSNVVSADVPTSIANLALAIKESPLRSTFLELSNELCHDLLMNAEEPIRNKYENFLTLHGHRCGNEAEFMERSWRSDPVTLMRTLKLLVANPLKTSPKAEDTSELDINKLKTPLSWLKKFIIKTFLLERTKAGVAARERGKSSMIKTNDVFRTAYWRLADMMVREGRLPEEKLLFFLTHTEIGTLIETRSATLVRKARRRMEVFRIQEKITYAELSFGLPAPLSEDTASISNESETVEFRGLPVGRGIATGTARVVVSLDDADNILPGDILICPFTDIGWSPYFPLISGLVTEMGGLISHGAVIAREFGIPCIVGVPSATKIFHSGDRVRIDGLGGVITKVTE